MSQRDITRKFFDGYAAEYGLTYEQSLSARECLGIILNMVGRVTPPGGLIMDLGCGPGYLADLLATEYRVAGVDISEKMIAYARAHARPGVPFFVGDVEEITDPKGFFNTAIAKGVFEYLETDDRLMSVAHEILRPGGFLIAEFRHAGFTHGTPGWVDPYPMKRRSHTLEGVARSGGAAGLKIVGYQFYHYHGGIDDPAAASAFVALLRKAETHK